MTNKHKASSGKNTSSKTVDEVPEETPSPQDQGNCSILDDASQDVSEKPSGVSKVLCDLFNSGEDTSRLRS